MAWRAVAFDRRLGEINPQSAFRNPQPIWSLPKVFHSCGKNCGKSTEIVGPALAEADFPMGSTRAKP